jgi:uncharacterized protein YjbI with pentapeptide repeats
VESKIHELPVTQIPHILKVTMAVEEHLKILQQGVDAWNEWRQKNPELVPNLHRAIPSEANLNKANLHGADLCGADLHMAYLIEADLRKAYLIKADLGSANLGGANLNEADLHEADLYRAILHIAYLIKADLSEANLRRADLRETMLGRAQLIETDLRDATLIGSRVYGASVWGIKVNEGTKQQNLVITDHLRGESVITVDNIKVAQFIHLLLNNQEIREVIDTIGQKGVLILGRFTEERKAVLDALREELRKYNLLPIVFDFERPTNADFTETIKILAGLSLFIIVDLTKPKAVPHELMATVPDYQKPFVPILEEGEEPYSMYPDLMKYDWVLKPLITYRTKEVLLANFKKIIDRAWKKHLELQRGGHLVVAPR